jgi:hypothetical protein
MRRRNALPVITSIGLLAVAGLLPALPAHGFQLQRHGLMTRQVLTRHAVTGAAASLIAFGAMAPDIEDCIPHCYCDYAPTVCQPDSGQAVQYAVNHFDNDELDESIYRINDRMAIAQSGIYTAQGQVRAAAIALVTFGRALHTTQDFYAHSTFLEVNLPVMRRDPLKLPLWQGQPYALFSWTTCDGLSGGGGVSTGWYLATPPAGGYTHDQLNKDSPGTPHGSCTVQISAGGFSETTLYGLASGDLGGGDDYTDFGLAPRHTVFALNVLLNGGYVFPYVFEANRAVGTPPGDVAQALAFFDWVNQDPELIAMAEAADSLIANADADSIGNFPMDALDADGLPIPRTVSVAPAATGRSLELAAPRPNPFTGATSMRFLAPRAGAVSLAVFDLEGRRVTTLYEGEAGPGWRDLSWDGRDGTGRSVPAGVYLVRLAARGEVVSRRLVRTP